MKEYSAHFSYYSEQYGNFEDMAIKIDAANQFEARTKAWEALDKNEDMNFMSCVKLCGITWDASPLDMQDYFNAEAALEKYRIQYIENVDKPNAKIEQNDGKLEYCERERYGCYGSLHTITHIAENLGKPHGMLPPAIFEELHYAREICYQLDLNDNDTSWALLKQIERAEKWDKGAMHSIQELFKHGYGIAGGHEYNFSAQFGKDGIYPVCADRSDTESAYIYRWTGAREYEHMNYLPFFGEKDVIANSQTMQYDWQTLVLKKEALPPDKQTPENSLWIANQESAANFSKGANGIITAENPVTGEIAEWKRSDFHGVLRPEKNAHIDFDAIKNEYKELCAKKEAFVAAGKPSLLGMVRENTEKIALTERTDKQDKPKKIHIGVDD